MKSEAEASRALALHADTVRRICFLHLRNYADVEDVFQDVFLKYILFERSFESEAHEKAWLIRVAVNRCRDVSRGFFRRNVVSLDGAGLEPSYLDARHSDVLDAVLALPEKYRDVVYLFYYEGYAATEIARILGKGENSIYTWLSRARTRLMDALGGELDGR